MSLLGKVVENTKNTAKEWLNYNSEIVVQYLFSFFVNGIDSNAILSANGVSVRECITSFEIEERIDGSDTLTINISDPEFLLVNDNIFIEEAEIELIMANATSKNIDAESVSTTNLEVVDFKGYISAIDINFPSDGCPTVKIYCLDRTHKMNRNKKKRTWENTTSGEVVQAIAKEYGYKCELEKDYIFETEKSIGQSDQTDIEFLESLAKKERDLFTCKLVGDTIQYKKKGLLAESVATFNYKKYPYDVVSFSPRINKETRREKIQVADISTDTKVVDSAEATNENTYSETQGEKMETSESTIQQQTQQETYTYKRNTSGTYGGGWE